MKSLTAYLLCLGCLAAASARAMDLKQSKVTQVVNDVQILSAANQNEKSAAVNDIFSMPDLLRTGPASRAELVAKDETVTRVGANTIFSFDPANRTIDLKQGSLLFHAPHGKGGGNIHTGSATASVLGTTLIITTTANGGFKVIALEGHVEVKFLNGLRQKLSPGEMTFVLPGANQLSPIIIFRLDELVRNSLLVKGFLQPLASLTLIQNEINFQLKGIRSGKLSDTGLYAGNNATLNQVEVLDLNTVSHTHVNPPPQSALDQAETTDATINQASLTDVTIPTPPNHVFTDEPFQITGNEFYNGQEFFGFVARNIYMNTLGVSGGGQSAVVNRALPKGDAGSLRVDLSPYANQGLFAIVAMNDFSIEGSVTFCGLSCADTLGLIAGNELSFTPGISISAAVQNLVFIASASMTLDGVTLKNPVNSISLNSGGTVSFQDQAQVCAAGTLTVFGGSGISITDSRLNAGSILFMTLNGAIGLEGAVLDTRDNITFMAPTAINLDNSVLNSKSVTFNGTGPTSVTINNTRIRARDAITIASTGDINVTGDTANPSARSTGGTANGSMLKTDPRCGTVSLSSAAGSVNVSGTSISAHCLTLNSGDGILLDGAGHTITATGCGATANFTAPNLVTVRNADLTSYGAVNIAANTVNLLNVAFKGAVNLSSLLGIWNNGSVMPGAINDLGGVKYNGTLLEIANGATGPISGTGIVLGTTH